MSNKVIIVLGMHRSGTSAMTGALQCMGVDLGAQLMSAKRGENDKGYFEHVAIVDVHERLLAALGSSWDDLTPLPSQWWLLDEVKPFRQELLALIKEFDCSALWGIKDPRMCRLMPLWDEMLRNLNVSPLFVVTFRHPEEVALSLQRRDKLNIPTAYLLWLIHLLEAEHASRAYPRVFVSYEGLLQDSQALMLSIGEKLSIAWAEQSEEMAVALDALISPAMRHCQANTAKMVAVIQQVYDILLNASKNGDLSSDDKLQLDQIREGIFSVSEVLLPSIAYSSELLKISRCAREEVERLCEVEQHLRKVVAESEQHVHKMQLHCDEFEEVVQNRDSQIDILGQEISQRDQVIDEMMHSTSWKMTLPIRFIGHQFKRMKLLWSLKARVFSSAGGVGGVLKKTLQIFRREGVAGLKARLTRMRQGGAIATGGGLDYAEWIRRYDTLDDGKRDDMHRRVDAFEYKPLISVVMPTFNSNLDWLTQAIESVRKQTYTHWELCIADDASSDVEVAKLLEHYASMDERIKICVREKNGHISAASNSALTLASGQWIALLDHDDLLAEQALFWVVNAINQQPDVCLIYSDEDKIDHSGERFDPYFKCDWNQDLFYSHNLITHLGIYRSSLLDEIGGFREGFEGAQDYDLVLRYIERIGSDKIHHIPRILYHWRTHAESTAQSIDSKPYAILAGEKALNEHFYRQGVGAHAEILDFGMYRVRYALPEKLPLVSLIIPTKNGLNLIRQCVESIIEKTTYGNYEIIIVDNASDEPAVLQYFQQTEPEKNVTVVRDERPFNYSTLNNTAVEMAQGELIGLINNDIEVISPDWLSEMVSHALRPSVGAVGAKLWYPDDTLQHGGVITGLGGVAGHSHKHLPKNFPGYFWRANLIQNLSAVTAACLIIRKSIYDEVGGLNETDLQVAFNDVDFCLRVRRAGYRNVWTPYAELYHHESATRGYEDSPEKKKRFSKEVQYMKEYWGEELLVDPNYSPNLTLDFEDFSLAWPPRTDEWEV